jgi:hypothetical protein
LGAMKMKMVENLRQVLSSYGSQVEHVGIFR